MREREWVRLKKRKKIKERKEGEIYIKSDRIKYYVYVMREREREFNRWKRRKKIKERKEVGIYIKVIE